ncbi:LysR family transcriptional regulator [Halomonas sp. FME1]|uniref:LysR family transcriptional regulator n=1 Tax=Halomonas casei TaxID=2742613 RepID=A0ABR9F0W0_9GAMM|nr:MULTISPECIES: LysR family transcriptional regulator [Halomonas]MBE0400098.1 LysR family transcriptional regulator [Halomonas casei]PCC20814.1 LysR family transcriptional regulator [Halomonas sp. JB37]
MDTYPHTSEIFRTVSALPPAELAAFLAVAQYGGFRAAARESGLSSSALSHAVAGLEARLKVQLFHRTTRHVSLTAAGQTLFTRLTPVLADIADAIRDLSDYATRPNGLLRINADGIAAEQILKPLVLNFMRAYPDMHVEILCEKRLVDLAEDGFDCGIRTAELVPNDMVAVPIGPEQQHIVVGAPSYLNNAPPIYSPADLAQHRCIQLRMPTGVFYRWEFESHGKAIVVETKGGLILDNSRLILSAAIEGYGLGYVTKWAAEAALASSQIAQVLTDWTPPYPGLCLYYPKHRHMSTGMQAFVAFSRSIAQKMS